MTGSTSTGSSSRRLRRWLPVLRTATVVGVGAGLVWAAGSAGPTVQWRWVPEQVAGAAVPEGPLLQPVSSAALRCPGAPGGGPESDSTPDEASVTVTAATAPLEALPPPVAVAGPGSLHLEQESAQQRGEVLTLTATAELSPLVRAQGALAPGLTAVEGRRSDQAQEVGLSLVPCAEGATESWLIGGGAEPGRLERLVLVNPGLDPIVVSATVHGLDGALPSTGGQEIAIAGNGRTELLLDALAPGEEAPAVLIRSSGGPVVAALTDRWLEGTLDRGVQTSGPVAPPATEVLIPAVPIEASGRAGLRVVVPGADPAVVRVRALTEDGPVGLGAEFTVVPGESSRELDLADLPEGTHGLQISADVPVVAAAQVLTGDPTEEEPTDLAWFGATDPVAGLAGTVLPEGLAESADLVLAAPLGGSATILLVDAAGQVQSRSVDVPAASVSVLEVDDARTVWVTPGTGTVHAGLVLRGEIELPGEQRPGEDEPDPPTPVALLSGLSVPEVPLTRVVPAVVPARP